MFVSQWARHGGVRRGTDPWGLGENSGRWAEVCDELRFVQIVVVDVMVRSVMWVVMFAGLGDYSVMVD